MPGGPEYTIDELARVADTTVRSVRVYHERGVLPPPEVRGRTGYYGAEHINRVRTISRLLNRGIKLNGIKELLAALDRGDDLSDVLGVVDVDQQESGANADYYTVTAAELQDRFGEVPDGLARVVAAGIFAPVDATTYRVADHDLAGLLNCLAAADVPTADILHEVERLRTDCDRVAHRIVGLVREHAWEPYAHSGRTPEDLAKFTARVNALRRDPGRAAGDLVGKFIERELEQDPEIRELLQNP
ncbi:MerR family transcriptional regulator [Nocardia sp. NBC_01327]|uniref:MerR family transcriptional regulator n=1 Tax=Nocardia sp. NBC_01327 TaxID=2903593 RepID=UPI002E127F86|nr:MerR family transcriptional regulator [Nocardia sp. NBC_01327]